MKFYIRRAQRGDLSKIISLAVEMSPLSVSFLREVSLEEVKKYRSEDLLYLYELIEKPHFGIFVAEDEGGNFLGHIVVGCEQVASSTGEKQGWIYDLSVKEEFQGKGVGKKLLKTAEEFAGKFKHKYIGLGVTSSNLQAVKFYEKMGYREERKKMLKRLGKEQKDG